MASQLTPWSQSDLTPEELRLVERHRRGFVATPGHTPAWRLVVDGLLALRALFTLAILALLVLLAISLVTVSGGLEQRVSNALQRTGQTFTAAGQAVSDVFNPTHPPRYPISQDTELSGLLTLAPGESIGQSAVYTFTLMDIRRRDDASGNPDIAQYAVLQRLYRTPRETKLLGITIHVDRGEQQYVLDRGETFRIGPQAFKVNWISAANRQMAAGLYRNPDEFAGKLAFASN